MSTSMYSGVAGMEAEQTKMDVIGNNIANVNTYGYKSQRAVFSDVYYQTLSAATRGTATKGGTNPSTVGVGSTLLGVQTMQKQSSFQSTSSGLDVAINGEGYLQVMDGSGNIFYTKAGMLGYDANTGYLVDMNGNFVLGNQGTTTGDGLQKIKLDNVGSVQAKAASATEDIDGTNFTISAQNASKAGNLSVNVISSDQMPIGQPVEATIANGTVTVTLNANEKFTSLDDLNTKINSALTVANGGKALDCGDLTISTDNADAFPASGLTGKQIAESNTGFDYGTINLPASGILGGFKLDSVGSAFQKAAPADTAAFTLTRTPAGSTNGTEESFTMSCTIGSGSKKYTGTVTKSQMESAGKLQLSYNGSTTDTITMSYPKYSQVMSAATVNDGTTWPTYPPTGTTGTQDLTSSINNGDVLGGVKFSGLASGDYISSVSASPASVSGGATTTTISVTVETPSASGSGTTPTTYTYPVNLSSSFQEGSIASAGGPTMTLPSKAEFLSSSNGSSDGHTAGITFTDAGLPSSGGYDVTSTEKSQNLGLTSKTFVMKGGTAGGAVTLNEIDDIAIGSDGAVTVHNADKGTVQVGRICLANFANPSGLQAVGSNYFKASLNSGDPKVSIPGEDSTGTLKSDALEMSNVDLASEFADMIMTQRGFQANSRIITVSDSMMEELVNLKR